MAKVTFPRALTFVECLLIGGLFFLPCTLSDEQCGPRRYWDPVTNKCDLCSHICKNSDQQATTSECEEKCPDQFKGGIPPSDKCPVFEYYDKAVEKCEPCDVFCHQAVQRGVEEECATKCKVYIATVTSTTTKPDTTSRPDERLHRDAHQGVPLTFLVVALVGVMIAFAVIVLLVWYRQTVVQKMKECFERKHRPIQVATDEENSLDIVTTNG